MKSLLQSFLPFTILLVGIVGGVMYFDELAAQQSQEFINKSVTQPVDQNQVAPNQVADALTLQTEAL